jgi:hypothetical protein
MGENDESVDPPVPCPWLELVVGIAVKWAVLTLPVVWVTWLLDHDVGRFPTWSWVLIPACPTAINVFLALWVRRPTHFVASTDTTPERPTWRPATLCSPLCPSRVRPSAAPTCRVQRRGSD